MFRLTYNAVQYTVNQLFKIAGTDLSPESVHVSPDTEHPSVSVVFAGSFVIVFSLISVEQAECLLLGQLRLKKIPSFDSKIEIPVVLNDPVTEFATIDDNQMVINADIITLSFLMLSRYEETLTEERDTHHRFEFKNSLAFKYDFIDVPIVDEYAMLMRMWLLRFLPDLKITRRTGKVIPTHDVDFLLRFGGLFKNIRTIAGGDLIGRRSISLAGKSIGQWIKTSRDSKNDPLIQAMRTLIDCSREYRLNSIFYFKGLKEGDKDCTYDISAPEARYCIDMIFEAGMETGMHAGYESYASDIVFKGEKEALETVYGDKVKKNRQHFLRFDVNKTLKIWEANGIECDSTLGYAEREGYRCGTAHEFKIYDLENDKVSSVSETPLIIMEGTLFQYRRLDLDESLEKILKLYSRTMSVEGDFVILWHNHSVIRDYEDKFRNVYCKFLDEIQW